MHDKNKTIVIGENKNSYKMPLGLIQMSMYLEYISLNSTRELKYIFDLLNLGSSSRVKYGNTIDFKTAERERINLRNINKALTMELFSSGIFGYIDNPTEVHANCLVSHCHSQKLNNVESHVTVPSNFAQGGVPDVQIDYEDFMVILEVSAKYQPSIEHYKKQLRGALKHARTIREDGYEMPIYCILINERSLSLVENIMAMKELLAEIKPIEKIYVTSMSIDEFSNLGQVLGEKYEEDISKMVSDDLHSILKATVEKGVNGKFHEILVEFLESLNPPTNGFTF